MSDFPWLVRIANPFSVKPEIVFIDKSLEYEIKNNFHYLELRTNEDVLRYVTDANRARAKAEKEAARKEFRAHAILDEASRIIRKLCRDNGYTLLACENILDRLYKVVREADDQFDGKKQQLEGVSP